MHTRILGSQWTLRVFCAKAGQKEGYITLTNKLTSYGTLLDKLVDNFKTAAKYITISVEPSCLA